MAPAAKTRPAPDIDVGQHDPALNIEQRLLAVMADLRYIQRDRTAPKEIGGFSFVSHDAVTSAVAPVLIKYGVYACSSVVDHGRDGNQTTLVVDTTFFNVDRPDDQRIIRTVGYGIDKQDKGPGKAMSYAVKYALLKALMLETGDDVEAEAVDRSDVRVTGGAGGAPTGGTTLPADSHSGGRAPLAKFWAVARGQKVPEEVIRMWYERNLGVVSTKDATDEQLNQATTWAQAFHGKATKFSAATLIIGLDARSSVEEAQRMFPGVRGLGDLTLAEWDELIGWAEAKANATLNQAATSGDTPEAADPNAPPF